MKVNLLEICTPKQWKTLATCELLESGKYDVYGANGIIGKYDEYNHEFPTVLITCRGATCGNVHLSKPFSYINGNAMALDNLDETKCLNKYLYYYLKGIDLSNSISGSAQPQITIHGLKKINIKLYDLNRQNEIVTNLSKIDNLINLKNNQIYKLEQLVKSQFVEMFGNMKNSIYNKKILSEVTLKITDGKHGGCESDPNSGYYFIGATEVFNNKIDYDNAKQITKKDFDIDYKRCDLKLDDFVIVNTGATIGKSAIVSDERCTKTLLQKSVALIRTDSSKILPIYIKYLYDNEPSLYNQGQGCARVNLLLSQIKNTSVPVPPIELQNKFAQIVEQIDKQKFVSAKILEIIGKLSNLW